MKLSFGWNRKKSGPGRSTPLRPWSCEQAWWLTLGFAAGPPASLEQVERRFRRMAAAMHPDRGGSVSEMQALVRARARARTQYRHG